VPVEVSNSHLDNVGPVDTVTTCDSVESRHGRIGKPELPRLGVILGILLGHGVPLSDWDRIPCSDTKQEPLSFTLENEHAAQNSLPILTAVLTRPPGLVIHRLNEL
jgi:hypothetical protein